MADVTISREALESFDKRLGQAMVFERALRDVRVRLLDRVEPCLETYRLTAYQRETIAIIDRALGEEGK